MDYVYNTPAKPGGPYYRIFGDYALSLIDLGTYKKQWFDKYISAINEAKSKGKGINYCYNFGNPRTYADLAKALNRYMNNITNGYVGLLKIIQGDRVYSLPVNTNVVKNFYSKYYKSHKAIIDKHGENVTRKADKFATSVIEETIKYAFSDYINRYLEIESEINSNCYANLIRYGGKVIPLDELKKDVMDMLTTFSPYGGNKLLPL